MTPHAGTTFGWFDIVIIGMCVLSLAFVVLCRKR
jgi:hypothetical protein